MFASMSTSGSSWSTMCWSSTLHTVATSSDAELCKLLLTVNLLVRSLPQPTHTYTLFTHNFLNRLKIGFVVKQLESGLIASTFTHSLSNRLRFNNCNIVGGASYLFPQALWFGHSCICCKYKQSRRGRLLKFQLEQAEYFLVFFLLVVYVVGRCFLAECGI